MVEFIQSIGRCYTKKQKWGNSSLIDEHIDRGQIAYQEEFPIDKTNFFDNYKIAFDISLDLCNQLIEDLNKNIIISDKIISKGSYYSWPTNHDSRLFKSKNLKIV